MKRPYAKPSVVSRPMRLREKCLVEGCTRFEELAGGRSAGGLCSGHRYRKKHGLPLEGLLDDAKAPGPGGVGRKMSQRQMLSEAALAVADAKDDAEFDRALDRLRKRAERYRAVRKAKR